MDNTTSNSNPLEDMVNNMSNMKEKYVVGILFGIIIIVIIVLVIFYYKLFNLEKSTCKHLSNMYPEQNGHIVSISPNSDDSKYMFRDYYIKTAANCCSTGDIKAGVVSTCALRDVIKQGARGLDFEIYSVDGQPVVGTSTLDKYTVKETYNKVFFKDALGVIVNYAFTSGSCPNPDDPIIIHLRFKSRSQDMYQNLGKIFKEQERYLMGPKYYFENNYSNFGEVPLLKLRKRIVLIVNNNDKTYANTKSFSKYVNMTSGSMFMRFLTNSEARNIPSLAELVKFNKKNMSIIIPDRQQPIVNPGSVASRKMGIQLIGMSFQKQDTSFLELNEFFNTRNTAFVLKPKELRFVQTYLPAPKKQDPKLSFAPKVTQAQGMQIKL